MNSVKYVARALAMLGVVWALLIPSLAFADDDERGSTGSSSCSSATASRNPHCSAPEVPIAAVYPALGGLSFVVVSAARRRRSN